MALDKGKIVTAAMSKLVAKGFVIDNPHSKQQPMVEAVVEALVDAITSDAEVLVSGGSSAGSYKVK